MPAADSPRCSRARSSAPSHARGGYGFGGRSSVRMRRRETKCWRLSCGTPVGSPEKQPGAIVTPAQEALSREFGRGGRDRGSTRAHELAQQAVREVQRYERPVAWMVSWRGTCASKTSPAPSCLTRVDRRLLAMLWQLAERSGRVTRRSATSRPHRCPPPCRRPATGSRVGDIPKPEVPAPARKRASHIGCSCRPALTEMLACRRTGFVRVVARSVSVVARTEVRMHDGRATHSVEGDEPITDAQVMRIDRCRRVPGPNAPRLWTALPRPPRRQRARRRPASDRPQPGRGAGLPWSRNAS